jgi:multiple sugar transport system ATP-binding protein
MVFLKMGGQDAVAVFHERQPLRPGEKVRLSPDPDRAHLFDADTGARLG